MTAVLVTMVSLAALSQFFLSYVRSLLDAYSGVDISAHARETAGIEDGAPAAREFMRITKLAEMCPAPRAERNDLCLICAYFQMLRPLTVLGPAIAAWAEREGRRCAYSAAVSLDRRLAYLRRLRAGE